VRRFSWSASGFHRPAVSTRRSRRKARADGHLLNAANAALLLAHDLRRDTEVGLLLLGPPTPPRFVRSRGLPVLKAYQPDIRANAALIPARSRGCLPGWRANHPPESSDPSRPSRSARSPWADVCPAEGRRQGHSRGRCLRTRRSFSRTTKSFSKTRNGFLTDRGALVVGLGPVALHTDHAIALVQNELDRREA